MELKNLLSTASLLLSNQFQKDPETQTLVKPERRDEKDMAEDNQLESPENPVVPTFTSEVVCIDSAQPLKHSPFKNEVSGENI